MSVDKLLQILAGSPSRPYVERPIGLGEQARLRAGIYASCAIGGCQRPGANDPSAPPSFAAALREQLGLRLLPTTAPVDVLVIDHVEQPSSN
jgi:hypothetical protein